MKQIFFLIFSLISANSFFFDHQNSHLGFSDSFSKLFDIKLDFSEITSKKSPIYEISAILINKNQIKFVLSFSPEMKKDHVLCASIKFQDLLSKIGFSDSYLFYYYKKIFLKRWDFLSLKTYSECDPVIQNFAAGILEGLTTYSKINDFYLNLLDIHAESNRTIILLKYELISLTVNR